MTDLFVFATRNKLRFYSAKGELTLEQLWDVPLRSKSGDHFDLNNIAQRANAALKEIDAENFVETKRTPAHTVCEARLEVVKYIIDVKLTEEKAAATKAERKQEKEKLLAILAEKQAGKLSDLTEKELQKRIAALEE